MRIGIKAAFGVRDIDLLQQRQRLRAQRGLAAALMHAQGFDQLVGHREARVQAGHRILEDHRDVFAEQAAPFVLGHGLQLAAVVGHARRRDPARIIDQPHQRQRGDAFAGAGFADDADHFAFGDRQVEAIDGRERGFFRAEFDPQVL